MSIFIRYMCLCVYEYTGCTHGHLAMWYVVCHHVCIRSHMHAWSCHFHSSSRNPHKFCFLCIWLCFFSLCFVSMLVLFSPSYFPLVTCTTLRLRHSYTPYLDSLSITHLFLSCLPQSLRFKQRVCFVWCPVICIIIHNHNTTICTILIIILFCAPSCQCHTSPCVPVPYEPNR